MNPNSLLRAEDKERGYLDKSLLKSEELKYMLQRPSASLAGKNSDPLGLNHGDLLFLSH
jgi:hypothetical protein